MAFNALKPVALRAMVWRPSSKIKLVKTPSRGLADNSQPLSLNKPIGAFRGGFFGFLLGSFVTSAGVYYYVLEDYKVSNELLTDDINTLQTSVQRVHKYVQSLEQKILELEKKFSTTKLVSAPGWAYVPDNGSQASLIASQPISGKRSRKPILGVPNPKEYITQQDVKLLRELALLDRENHRDVSVPIPPKQNSEQSTGRGNHGKMTAAVRKILQSNKTFANYLADSEAAQASSATTNSSGGGFYTTSTTPTQLATPISRTTTILGSVEVITNSNSGRRSSKRKNTANSNRDTARGGTIAARRKSSLAALASSPTETVRMEKEMDKRKMSISEDKISSLISTSSIKTTSATAAAATTNANLDSPDNDPLLVSWIPVMPSEDELRRLLTHPPLSYLDARGPLVEEDRKKPARHFCERCGYWAKVKCVKCGSRVCNLDCYKEHNEECLRYGP